METKKYKSFGPWFLKSKKRLFVVLLVGLLLPTAIFVFLMFMEARYTLRKEAFQQNALAARLAARAIEEHFTGLIRYVESYAQRKKLGLAAEVRDTKLIQEQLREMVVKSPEVDRAFISDLNGVEWVDFPHDPLVIGRNFSYLDWHRGVSKVGQTYVSEVYLRDAEPRRYIIAIASPIRNHQGVKIGYLVAQHAIENLSAWLSRMRGTFAGSLVLIDHNGNLAVRHGLLGDPPLNVIDNHLVQKVLAGREETVVDKEPIGSEESVISYVPVQPVGWGILSSQSLHSIFTPLRKLKYPFFILTLIFLMGVIIPHLFWLRAVHSYHELQKATARAIYESEERLRSIVETATEGIISTSHDGKIIAWNKGAETMFGHSVAEAIGKPETLIIPERFREASLKGIERFNATGHGRIGGKVVELAGLRKDGAEFPIELSISSWAANGERFFTAVIRDISNRKMLEQEREEKSKALEQSNRELARRARVMKSLLEDLQAKRELEEQKRTLQEANQRLQELSAIKDQFVATVGHELRTPLTAIKEGIGLFLDQVLGPMNVEQLDFLATVDENIDQLTRLIDNILDLSKIEAGRVQLSRKKVAVQDLIQATVQRYRPMIGARTVHADLADVSNVLADPDRILQVLGNLFSNAVKFTKNDGIITFSAEQRDNSVAVSVEDNGVGIAKDDLPKLFQKFSQIGEGENSPRGTGLGLVVCKELVELHKGTISVESHPGKGSKFTFTLPLYSSDFALEEGFHDQVGAVNRNGQRESVGVVAVDGRAFLKVLHEDKKEELKGRLEEIVEMLRKRLRMEETVLLVEPHWIVVLAASAQAGMQAVLNRIQEALYDWASTVMNKNSETITLQLGVAVLPDDGLDIHSLFLKAKASVGPISCKV
ncbi:MAG: PAS domain S-box protein [Candidatus Omnitrophica bacterium]|nr:PAS domain S-box protein [Candidatus Omnitrophota bacterium]